MDLFHFVKAYAESEVRELKTKRDGGKLLVICWRGRGLSVLLEWRLENRQAQLASRGKPALERKLCRQILGCGLAKNNYWKRRLVSKKILDAGFDGVYLDIINAFEYFKKGRE